MKKIKPWIKEIVYNIYVSYNKCCGQLVQVLTNFNPLEPFGKNMVKSDHDCVDDCRPVIKVFNLKLVEFLFHNLWFNWVQKMNKTH